MRLISFPIIMILVLSGCAHSNSKLSKIKPDKTVQYWHLEWYEGFVPDTGIHKGNLFDRGRTLLRTDISDSANWIGFTAGCNGIGRSQSLTADGRKFAGISVQQVACGELICDGNKTREVWSRYSKVENLLATHQIHDEDRKTSPERVVEDGETLTWLTADGQPFAKFIKTETRTRLPLEPLICK